MRILAFILLLACLWDIIQTIIVIETGRRDNSIPTFCWPYYKHFKAAAYQILMNTLAAVFFVMYLFGQ